MTISEPIFKQVFADHWATLPVVMQKHYLHHPYSKMVVTVKGQLDIKATGLFKILLPVCKLFHILVPYTGLDIPVTVYLRSQENSPALYFDRTFYVPEKNPCRFQSSMLPIKDNIVVEFIFMGIGWRTAYAVDGNKVMLKHSGYVMRLFGKLIPLPITFLLGQINVEKEALSDDEFSMRMTMSHMLFGEYSYSGKLKIVDVKV